MKVKTVSALAGLGGALILSSSASATYVNLSLFAEEVVVSGGLSRQIYRLYANFTNSTDRINAWGGSGTLGAAHIEGYNLLLNTPANFYNPGGAAGQIAPYSSTSSGQQHNGTYMTIGVRYGNEAPGGADAVTVVPGTQNFIGGVGTALSSTWDATPASNGGVFIVPTDAQGAAGFNSSALNDTSNRVLLAQFALNVGDGVRGTIGIAGDQTSPLAANFVAQGQTFDIPAPGALALLGLAGLVGTRRRRG